MSELDINSSEHEKRLIQVNDSYRLISDHSTELAEAQHVFGETAIFFDSELIHSADPDVICVDDNLASIVEAIGVLDVRFRFGSALPNFQYSAERGSV